LHGYSLDRRMSIGAFEPLFDEEGRAARPVGTAASDPAGFVTPGPRTYRRVYPDLPFMGESTDAPGGEGHDGILAAMRDFILEVAPSGPILLAGESYGGYLSRGLSKELGDRVAGMFLLCPQIVPISVRDIDPPCVIREDAGWREAALASGASEQDIAEYEYHAVSRSVANFKRTRDEIIAGIRLFRSESMGRYLAGREGFSFDCMGKIGSGGESFDRYLDGPVCFFNGRQDRSVGWRDALRLAPRYPRASYVVADGAGHNAQTESPALFATAFSAWIAACEAAAR